MITNIIVGIIMIAVGVAFIIKTEYFLDNFGRMEWFETKMGLSGGSRLGYKLLGFILCFLGLMTAVGLIGGFINWVFSPITKYTAPTSETTVQF